jgi:hypothetical protein
MERSDVVSFPSNSRSLDSFCNPWTSWKQSRVLPASYSVWTIIKFVRKKYDSREVWLLWLQLVGPCPALCQFSIGEGTASRFCRKIAGRAIDSSRAMSLDIRYALEISYLRCIMQSIIPNSYYSVCQQEGCMGFRYFYRYIHKITFYLRPRVLLASLESFV